MPPASRILRGPRQAALIVVSAIIAAASLVSFAESYRSLYIWADHHGVPGIFAVSWPLMVDAFIAVGELALFVALADNWPWRSRTAAWAVTLGGLVVSVAGNIGHIGGHDLASRATAAVPPLAAAAALSLGLGLLKRIASQHAAETAAATTPYAVAHVTHTAAHSDAAQVTTAKAAQLTAGASHRDSGRDMTHTAAAPAATETQTETATAALEALLPHSAELASASPADRVRITAAATATGSPSAIAAALTAAGYPTKAEAARSALRRDRRDFDRQAAAEASVTRLPDRTAAPAS
jgi:hypothetical protein